MTSNLRKAINGVRFAKEEGEQAMAFEVLEAALREWRDSEVKAVLKKCIRIVSECQNKTDVSTVDVLVETFADVL